MKGFIEERFYRRILACMPIPCVDIALVHKGRVLLVQRDDPPARGEWWVPGGRVLKNERMRDTAARKAFEEVGVPCHVGPIVHTAETIFPDGPGGIAVHSINSCFLVYPMRARVSVRLDGHHRRARWVEAVPEGLHPYVEACLRGAGLSGQEPEKDT